MKRVIISAAAILGVVVLFVAVIGVKMRAARPDVLIANLRKATGAEREELIMKLGMARGDPVPAIIEAFEDPATPRPLKLTLLDLLFRKNRRVPDERIGRVLDGALKADSPAIRLAAVEGFSVYGETRDRLKLIDSVSDPDPAVREKVYAVFTSKRRWQGPRGGLWNEMDGTQRTQLLERVQEQVAVEQDPEVKLAARSVLGRQITVLCDESTQLLLKSDVQGAEEKLREALALDPENHQARVRLARFFLQIGDTNRALQVAREFDAVYPIPRLTAAPTIDGDPTEAAWDGAYKHDTFYLSTHPWVGIPSEGKGTMLAGYYDGSFYVAAISYEKNMDELLFKDTSHDGQVWQGDCIEVFFDPFNTEQGYYQFIVNAIGGTYDAYGKDTSRNFPFEARGAVHRERGYWAAEFAVAAEALDGAVIKPGTPWGFSVVRTRIGPGSEACVSWPTFGSNLKPSHFALAVFEPPEKR